jgi:hypothetical protein
LREGVKLETHLLEDNAVDAIVRFLLDSKTDLLVIGLTVMLRTYRVYGARFMMWRSVRHAVFYECTNTLNYEKQLEVSIVNACKPGKPTDSEPQQCCYRRMLKRMGRRSSCFCRQSR